jgi:hypothetical protein
LSPDTLRKSRKPLQRNPNNLHYYHPAAQATTKTGIVSKIGDYP